MTGKAYNVNKILKKNFKIIIFTIGFILVIERGYECLQKYLYLNIGTKIRMVNSNETVLPALVICPR